MGVGFKEEERCSLLYDYWYGYKIREKTIMSPDYIKYLDLTRLEKRYNLGYLEDSKNTILKKTNPRQLFR